MTLALKRPLAVLVPLVFYLKGIGIFLAVVLPLKMRAWLLGECWLHN